MPIFLIACFFAGAFGAHAQDQHEKRKSEQAAHRAELQKLQAALARNETELAAVRSRLGEKNEQVRILAAEVLRLRARLSQETMAA